MAVNSLIWRTFVPRRRECSRHKRTHMNLKLLGFGLSCLILFSLVNRSGEPQKTPTPTKPKLAISIKPQHVADALRAVILSDREIYTQVAAGLHGRLTRTSGTN